MKLKLDENLSPELFETFVIDGHDVHTVEQEGLKGAGDDQIILASRNEARCLVTLDLDFANVLHYPPEEFGGIVVLRHPAPRLSALQSLIGELLLWLKTKDPTGRLWIIEPGRLREHDLP